LFSIDSLFKRLFENLTQPIAEFIAFRDCHNTELDAAMRV
jgi:hypothetical protein